MQGLFKLNVPYFTALRLPEIIPLLGNNLAVLQQLQSHINGTAFILELKLHEHAPTAGFRIGDNKGLHELGPGELSNLIFGL